MKKRESDAQWMRRVFPSDDARAAADVAIDSIDVDRSMAEFLDVWVAAYVAAGGKTTILKM